jgi:hypothetical protein
MGWCEGSDLADNIWDIFEDIIPQGRETFYAQILVDLFEQMDCDTMEECNFYQIWLNNKE